MQRIPVTKAIKVTIYEHRCTRCKGGWRSIDPHPKRCSKCKSPYWDRERLQRNERKGQNGTS